jgi:hypothetical protein
MKNAVFLDVTQCGSCKNRRFVGKNLRFHSHLVFLRSVRQLLVTANDVPSSPILVTLKTAFFIVTAVKTSNRTSTKL